jgi:hypothetical protein
MSSNLQLAITASSENLTADLTLRDSFSVQIAQRPVDLDDLQATIDQVLDQARQTAKQSLAQ